MNKASPQEPIQKQQAPPRRGLARAKPLAKSALFSLPIACALAVTSAGLILSSCGSASPALSGTGAPTSAGTSAGAATPSVPSPPPAAGTLKDGCQLMSRSLAKSLSADPNIGPASGAHPNCNYLDQTTGPTSGDHAGVLITPSSAAPTAIALQSAVQQNAYFAFPGFSKPFHFQQEDGLGDLAYTFTGSSTGVVFAKNGDIVVIYVGTLTQSDATILTATNSLAASAAADL